MLVIRLVNEKAFSKFVNCSEKDQTQMTEETSQKTFAQKSHESLKRESFSKKVPNGIGVLATSGQGCV